MLVLLSLLRTIFGPFSPKVLLPLLVTNFVGNLSSVFRVFEAFLLGYRLREKQVFAGQILVEFLRT